MPLGGIFSGIARGLAARDEQERQRRAEEMSLFSSLLQADEEDEPALRAFAASRGFQLPIIQREQPVEYDVPGLGRMRLRRRDIPRYAPFFQMQTQRDIAAVRAENAQQIAEFKAGIQERLAGLNADLRRDLASTVDIRMRDIASLNDERIRAIATGNDQRARELAGLVDQRMRDIARMVDETRRRGQDISVTIADRRAAAAGPGEPPTGPEAGDDLVPRTVGTRRNPKTMWWDPATKAWYSESAVRARAQYDERFARALGGTAVAPVSREDRELATQRARTHSAYLQWQSAPQAQKSQFEAIWRAQANKLSILEKQRGRRAGSATGQSAQPRPAPTRAPSDPLGIR